MMLYMLVAIAIGAVLGAWLRWFFGNMLNHFFSTIPLGTLLANILGGYLIGIIMGLTREHSYFSETMRLAITTGFLGSLTTFSTFSAETVSLLTHQQYGWFTTAVISHVAGSILATILGMVTVKSIVGG